MKKTENKFATLALTALAILATGCGTEGTRPTTLPSTSLSFDFRVTSTSPVNNSTNVNTTNGNLQVFFSEEVDPTTVTQNIIVRKEGISGSQEVQNVDINPIGNMVDVVIKDRLDNAGAAISGLQPNNLYRVILMSGITSANQNQLYDGQYAQGVEVKINTGTSYGNSFPGPPFVTSINKFSNGSGCFSAMVRFSEDVNLFLNDITVESSILGNKSSNLSLVRSTVSPYYIGRQDVWVVDADCSNGLAVWAAVQRIRVKVVDAIDLEGNNLSYTAAAEAEF